MSYTVKVKHGDDLRRVTMTGNPPTMSLLASTLQSLFGPSPFKVRYQDDDGDLVTISSDQELLEAFLTVKQLPLRLDIIQLQQQQQQKGGEEEAMTPVAAPAPSRSSSVSSTSSSFAVVTGKEDEEDDLSSSDSDDEDEEDEDDGEDEDEKDANNVTLPSTTSTTPASPTSAVPQVANPLVTSSAITPVIAAVAVTTTAAAAAKAEAEAEAEAEEIVEDDKVVAAGNSSDDTLATASAPPSTATGENNTTNDDEEEQGEEEEGEKTPTTPTSQDQQQQQQPPEVPEVPLVEFFLNEFHYHRLIVQTAVEAAFSAHRPKTTEFFNKVDAQRILIIEAIEKTLEEWKRDITSYPPAKEISDRVSESLKELGTIAAPVIERIRVTLNAALESLFERKSPEAITSADVVRELDTFSSPREQQEHADDDGEDGEGCGDDDTAHNTKGNTDNEHRHQVMSDSATSQTNEELDTLLAKLAADSGTAASTTAADLRIPSDLTDDFVYLDGYQNTDDAAARQREQEAHEASEVVWQNAEEFQFQEELVQIQLMGFANTQAIREALINCHGNVDQALDTLL